MTDSLRKKQEDSFSAFAATPSYAAVAADAGPAFGNITQRRFLLLAPTYLLVVDELRSTDGQEHTFDWIYHNKGTKALCDLPAGDSRLGKVPPGYSYLKDISAFKTSKEGAFEVTFPDDQLTTRLTMLGHPGDELFTATGPLASVTDRVPVIIVRRKGRLVRFITLLEPVDGKRQPDVRGLGLLPGDKLSINISRSAGEDRVTFTGESLVSFSVSGRSVTSERAVVLRSD